MPCKRTTFLIIIWFCKQALLRAQSNIRIFKTVHFLWYKLKDVQKRKKTAFSFTIQMSVGVKSTI